MGLFRRKHSLFWWMAYSIAGRQFRESTGTTSKRLAEQALAKRKTEITEGKFFPEKKRQDLTMGGLRKMWLEHAESVAKKTVSDDKQRLDQAVDFFGERTPVVTLLVSDIDRFKRHLLATKTRLGRPAKPATVNRIVSTLRSALHLAAQNGCQHHIPPRSIKMLPEKNTRSRICSLEEYQLLVDGAYPKLRLAIILGYHTGMRLGEIVNLTWSQVDLKARMIRLRPTDTKTGEGRTIPMSSTVYEALKAWPRNLDGTVFGASRSTYSHEFYTLCKKLEIRDLHFHDLRHTALTNLRKAGVDVFTMKAISGHKTMAMMSRYQTVTEDDMRSAIQKLEKRSP